MRLNRIFGAIVVAMAFSFLLSAVCADSWSALGSGYAVTRDYHGIDVIPFTEVTVTARTTDADVETVTFVWKYPNGTIAFIDAEVPVWSNGTYYDSKLIQYAQSSNSPNTLGDWGVQAFFNGEDGSIRGQESDVIAIRATSFFVIPEVPLGTVGILLAFAVALALMKTNKVRIRFWK